MPLVRVLVLALLAVFLAGCAQTPPSTPPGIFTLLPTSGLVAFTGAGVATAVPSGIGSPTWAINDVKHSGAEPTMGVDAKGTLYVVSANDVFRSKDNGTTWQMVSPPANFPKTLDPLLWVDQDTGRVFLDHLYLACSYLAFSDDQGASWLYNPAACGIPADDHQTLTTGKPVGVPLMPPVYPNVVYYGWNGIAYSGVARSLDGGMTFAGGVIAIDQAHCGGLNGHMKTDKDGIVYLPAAGCDEPVVAVSRDSGLTWEQHTIATGGAGRSTPGDDPSIALDTAGNAYLIWPGKDAKMYGSVSTDKGKTWGTAFHISPPGITSSLEPVSIAGDAGRVAFGYYATTADTSTWKTPNSDDAPKDARWHLYVTYSLDAIGGPSATFVTQQLTPDDNPISIGRVHNGGSDGTPDRNLLDFFDMVRDGQGRVYVAYTDGCYHKCASDPATRLSQTTVATLTSGPGLLSAAPMLGAPARS